MNALMERALCPILVGREDELTELEEALLASNRGEGQVVLLAGDAGMGKTRLASELARRARSLGMSVLVGGCSEAELSLPYLPFLEAIGNHLAGSDLDGLRSKLGPVRRELAHLFPQLEPEGVPADSGDQTQGKLRLFEGILALLSLIAAEHGLLMVVEDLHWADASTRELLDYFTRRLRNARILVLGTYRRDEMHRRHPLLPLIQGWRRSSAATIVDLEPLSPAKVGLMVSAIFDQSEKMLDDTRDFLHQRSEGNPFVLEEMLKMALDRGDIFRTETGWTQRALADLRLPESVRDTILLRVDRLQADQVDVLRTAAVLGRDFDYAILVEVASVDTATVQQAVEASIQQQLLVDVPSQPGRYRFRHALTREAIYNDMILPRRVGLHARAAEVLMAREGVSAEELCNHLLAGGRRAAAVPLALEAAAAAERAYAYPESAELYEKVLAEIPPGEQLATVLCQLGIAHHRAANPGRARSFLGDGIEMLESLGEFRLAAGYRLDHARCSWEAGEPVQAEEEYEAARKVLEDFGPSEELALAYVRLSGARALASDFAPAADLADKAMELAQQAGADLPRIWAGAARGLAVAYLGRADEGIELLDRSFSEAVTRGFFYVAEIALYNGCVTRLSAFRGAELRQRLDLFTTVPPSIAVERATLTIEAMVAEMEGRLGDRLVLHRRTMEKTEFSGGLVFWRQAAAGSAGAFIELGRLDEAESFLSEVGEPSGVVGRLGVLILRQQLAILRGTTEQIREYAEALLEELKMGRGFNREEAIDICSQGLLALDQEIGLARLAAAAEAEFAGDGHPHRDRVLARHALAQGDFTRAAELASSSVDFFDSRGYRHEAAWSRLLLGDAMARAGDSRASGVLESLIEEASRRDALAMIWRAQAVAARAGLSLESQPPTAAERPPAAPESVGERLVTVLFADVRGYTALTQAAVPEEMVDRIATFQRWAITEIERNRGHVDKFAGDAVMATFNISGSQVDHAIHAFRCAMGLRDKAAALQLPLGCGIATGPAMVGTLATGANVSVLGEATNLASRLQAQAGPGEILLSDETHRRLRGWFDSHGQAAQVMAFQLKGYEVPVSAYRVGQEAVV